MCYHNNRTRSFSIWNIQNCFWIGAGENGEYFLKTSLQTVLGDYYLPLDMNQLKNPPRESTGRNNELEACQYSGFVIITESEVSKCEI